ncbi:MAG: hypothetical protein ACE5JK_07035 [Candidatus Omnitrophota bacterium]
MKYFRTNILTVAVLFLFGASLLYLAGCGPMKKAEEPKVPKEEARPVPSTKPITEERTYYDFEGGLGGWEVPMWATGKSDYVAKEVNVSSDVASKGEDSMKVEVDFPGGIWAAGLVEIQQYLDMSRYRVVRVDIYLPEGAPIGLKAKLILTVGSNWKFVEMSRSVPLIPGEWATITANIEPGSYDWKRVVPDEKFAEDVRKIAIRIESNRKPRYTGTIYIDNVRVGR